MQAKELSEIFPINELKNKVREARARFENSPEATAWEICGVAEGRLNDRQVITLLSVFTDFQMSFDEWEQLETRKQIYDAWDEIKPEVERKFNDLMELPDGMRIFFARKSETQDISLFIGEEG